MYPVQVKSTMLDYSQPPQEQTLIGHSSCVTSLVVSGGFLASGSADKTIKVWETKTVKCLKTLSGHSHSINALAVLQNGNLASGSTDYSIKIWDISKGKCLKTLKDGNSEPILALAVLPNGNLVSGSLSYLIRIWDTSKGNCIKNLTNPTFKNGVCDDGVASVTALAVLLNGHLACGYTYGFIDVWDTDKEQCLQTFREHTIHISALAVLSNGFLACGFEERGEVIAADENEGVINVWDTMQGSFLTSLSGHSKWTKALQMLPYGRLISGSLDKTIKVWDVIQGSCLHTFNAHKSSVEAFALLSDGRLASGSEAGDIKLWQFPEFKSWEQDGASNTSTNNQEKPRGYEGSMEEEGNKVLPNGNIIIGTFKGGEPWNAKVIDARGRNLSQEYKNGVLQSLIPNIRVPTDSKLMQRESMSTTFTPEGNSSSLQKIIDTVVNALFKPDFTMDSFYHSSINRDDTEKRLRGEGIPGAFIIRASSQPGLTAISYLSDAKEICHTLIRIENHQVQEMQKEQAKIYPSLLDFFNCHRGTLKNPIPVALLDEETKSLQATSLKSLQQEQTPSPLKPSINRHAEPQQWHAQLQWRQQNYGQFVESSPNEEIACLLEEQKALQEALKANQQQQQALESKMSELEKRGESPPQLAITQQELQELMTQHSVLQAEYEVKSVQRAAQEAFKANPNHWSFYRTVNIRLEEIFIGCKAVASDFIETDLTGNLNTAATGITILGKLASLIPLIGNSLDTTVSTISSALQTIDHQRQTNLLKSMSALGTLSDIEKVAESTARQLTQRYLHQLEVLLTREEAKQHKSKPVAFLSKGKEEILCEQPSSHAEEVANFGVLQILGALLDRSIQPDTSLEEQFLGAVITPPSRLDHIKKVVLQKLGINKLTTRENKSWCLQDFYCKPGIQTPEGKYYAGKTSDPALYGYRLGTLEEAKELGLVEVTMTMNKTTTTAMSSIPKVALRSEPITTTTVTTITTTSSNKPPIATSKVEELEKALEKAQAKMDAQERDALRRDAELRKIQLQMAKLLKGQEDSNVGNQAYINVQTSDKEGERYTPSLGRLATQHVQVEGRMRVLEQQIASMRETMDLQPRASQKVDENAREELLSQESHESLV